MTRSQRIDFINQRRVSGRLLRVPCVPALAGRRQPRPVNPERRGPGAALTRSGAQGPCPAHFRAAAAHRSWRAGFTNRTATRLPNRTDRAARPRVSADPRAGRPARAGPQAEDLSPADVLGPGEQFVANLIWVLRGCSIIKRCASTSSVNFWQSRENWQHTADNLSIRFTLPQRSVEARMVASTVGRYTQSPLQHRSEQCLLRAVAYL